MLVIARCRSWVRDRLKFVLKLWLHCTSLIEQRRQPDTWRKGSLARTATSLPFQESMKHWELRHILANIHVRRTLTHLVPIDGGLTDAFLPAIVG